MRMSCNGCRILRKGCSENCSIRPCLQWIKTPDSQANATVFLAKFYGRAGLINLINAGPEHLRPAIFRSLLYEACGRIVNPIYGSVGLLWSGSWQMCQAAVEAVLKGAPITPIATDAAATSQGPPLKAYDIRHVSKDESSGGVITAEPAGDRLKVRPGRCRFKRSAGNGGGSVAVKPKPRKVDGGGGAKWAGYCKESSANRELNRSDDSSVSHQSEAVNAVDGGESKETESMMSVETVELAVSPPPPAAKVTDDDRDEPRLELTLGLEPTSRVVPVKKRRVEALLLSGDFDGACKTELGLECPA